MIDMIIQPTKPKKTILVKVSSNDALPKSELASKQADD